ncbi:MAG: DUF262 domain-containing protein [Flavobacteriales bacterium]|nr:DUF262 domain-containing protein [Flavobacteriales bacterium]MCB9203873.1 DUF262 domain-containing protein [Flavobacteriales bacterium]
MNATDPSLANILQTQGNLEHYHIPKYQREYTWGKGEWEQLLNDIEENDPGYFMGSIICIDDNPELGPGESRIYELVDGQQRLTTISLLLMAIYRSLREFQDEMDDDVMDDEEWEEFSLKISTVRQQLLHKKSSVNKTESGYFKEKDKYCFLRVQPSSQRDNYADYLYILGELAILRDKHQSKFAGLRRIYKAYDYFYSHLPEELNPTIELLDKINSLKFIHISVSSSSDAFTLFESLNNRGVPLSIMDILKNKMLAHLEKQKQMDVDEAYDTWQDFLSYLPDYQDQERFLRHYYNAFKVYPDKKVHKFPRATKSNLIKIFETYIKEDAEKIFADLLEKADIYNHFIQPENEEECTQTNALIDLKRIGGSSAYLLLLYLYSLPKSSFDDMDAVLDDVLNLLVKYYVRRNITDFPNTRDLDAINIEVIEKCHEHVNAGKKISYKLIVDTIFQGKGKPSSLDQFRDDLSDNLYQYNVGMARFVLAKLDEVSHSREYNPDLWERNNKGLLVWTIEHVLPQGEKIPEPWVKMIADGDYQEAKRIHADWVHCLGNLTLSGYNSKLSNASFDEKQSLHKDQRFLGQKINIGYKNGLALNSMQFELSEGKYSLANVPKWNEESIEARNDAIVDLLIQMFAFDDEL